MRPLGGYERKVNLTMRCQHLGGGRKSFPSFRKLPWPINGPSLGVRALTFSRPLYKESRVGGGFIGNDGDLQGERLFGHGLSKGLGRRN